MIEIKEVHKNFGNKEVIKNMNLEIEDGYIFGFIGPNAAGKTTTINMITGSTSISSGDILVNGKSIKTNPVEAKREIGYVPDSPDMFLNMKVIDFFNFVADIYGVSEELRSERIERYSKDFEITHFLKDDIESLSHGTRQKVIIISVLIHEPNIWVLDEPMTGLDPKASFTLKKIMKEHVQKGHTVFFSTHVLEVAEKLCDKIAIINQGKIVYLGGYDELKAKYPDAKDLEELFIKLIGGKNE